MFNRKCSMIGMVHLQPLPGAAGYDGCIDRVMSSALDEAMTFKENGFDALMLENMHDVPYLKGRVEPETTASMAVMAAAIKYETQMPLGIQILAGANLEALGAAIAAGLDFIRVEAFVFGHLGDEGYQESSAPELIRRRFQLRAEKIKIFADIKKKHSSHAITQDISLVETARAAEFFKADGVIVTGEHTGDAPKAADLESVRRAVDCHVLVGSGVSAENIHEFQPWSDAIIVGSSLKVGGKWQNPLDSERVRRFMERSRELEAKMSR
ncbi:MAG: BtpA/SgcQ family protein [Candidatus Obscuribacterales bacterium]|nr:BtpA/SgcQ family protein [Candidatus Obscuribacterales bacterium]